MNAPEIPNQLRLWSDAYHDSLLDIAHLYGTVDYHLHKLLKACEEVDELRSQLHAGPHAPHQV